MSGSDSFEMQQISTKMFCNSNKKPLILVSRIPKNHPYSKFFLIKSLLCARPSPNFSDFRKLCHRIFLTRKIRWFFDKRNVFEFWRQFTYSKIEILDTLLAVCIKSNGIPSLTTQFFSVFTKHHPIPFILMWFNWLEIIGEDSMPILQNNFFPQKSGAWPFQLNPSVFNANEKKNIPEKQGNKIFLEEIPFTNGLIAIICWPISHSILFNTQRSFVWRGKKLSEFVYCNKINTLAFPVKIY